MAEEDIQPLVCDNGTGMVKVSYPVTLSIYPIIGTDGLQLRFACSCISDLG
jgi:hypothetical protein